MQGFGQKMSPFKVKVTWLFDLVHFFNKGTHIKLVIISKHLLQEIYNNCKSTSISLLYEKDTPLTNRTIRMLCLNLNHGVYMGPLVKATTSQILT